RSEVRLQAVILARLRRLKAELQNRSFANLCLLPTAHCLLIMTSLQFVSHLIELYGVYGLFVLVMIEGDLTLLLAGVLAHSGFFDEGLIKGYGFAKVLLWGTLAGFASDNLAYGAGPIFSRTVRNFRFYPPASRRLQRMTD